MTRDDYLKRISGGRPGKETTGSTTAASSSYGSAPDSARSYLDRIAGGSYNEGVNTYAPDTGTREGAKRAQNAYESAWDVYRKASSALKKGQDWIGEDDYSSYSARTKAARREMERYAGAAGEGGQNYKAFREIADALGELDDVMEQTRERSKGYATIEDYDAAVRERENYARSLGYDSLQEYDKALEEYQQSGEYKYAQRKEAEDAAKSDFWSGFWKYLGGAAQTAQEAQSGAWVKPEEQAARARESAAAATQMREASQRQKEAAKAVEWEGRQELIDELKALDRSTSNSLSPENQKRKQRAEEIRRQLAEGDLAAGNGVRSYTGRDRVSSVLGGSTKEYAAGIVNADATMSDYYSDPEHSLRPFSRADIAQIHAATGDTSMQEQQEQQRIRDRQRADEMYATADRMTQEAAAEIQKAKEGLGVIGQAGVDIAENVIQMGYDAALGYVTGGLGAAAGVEFAAAREAGSLGAMFVRTFGSSAQEARQSGATLEQQISYGAVKGGIEVVTEKLFDGVAGIYGKGTADDVVKKVISRLTESQPGSALLVVLSNAINEGAEEVISDLLAPFAERIYNDEALGDHYFDTLDPSELLYDFLIGAAIGGLGNVMSFANGQIGQDVAEIDAMRAQEFRGVDYQARGAMDVLSGRRTAEQQAARDAEAQARSERAEARLAARGLNADGSPVTVRQQVAESLEQSGYDREQAERTAELLEKRMTGQEMSEEESRELGREQLRMVFRDLNERGTPVNFTAEQEEVLQDGYENEKDTNRQTYALAMREAYRYGQLGLTLGQALQRTSFRGKVEEINYRHAFEMGAGQAVSEAQGAEGREAVETALAGLGIHAGEAADVIQEGQDAETYAAAMDLTARYVANGGSAAEYVQAARDGEMGETTVSTLTDAQAEVAQRIGEQMREARQKETQERIDKRQRINDRAETLLEQENPDVKEFNGIIRDAEAYLREHQPELDRMTEELDAMRQADPEAESTAQYQTLLEEANRLGEDLSTTRELAEKMRAERKGLQGVVVRKAGTVSYNGGSIEGKTYEGVDPAKLTKEQKRVTSMVEALADVVNLDYHFFSGDKNMGGSYVKGGQIYINLNSAVNVRSFARQISAATLSHELTHFTQDFAEAEYTELRDFVVQTVMKKSPAEFHKLVLQQLRWEPTKSYDEMVDEVVANGCMTMLQNTQAVKQIVREHLNWAERFGERLHEIGAKLKAAYEGIDVNEDAAIYHAAKILSESHDEIQARWDKALAAATRNYNAEKTVERITGKPARPTTKVAVKARTEAKENAAPKGDVQFMSFKSAQKDGFGKLIDRYYSNTLGRNDPIYIGTAGTSAANLIDSNAPLMIVKTDMDKSTRDNPDNRRNLSAHSMDERFIRTLPNHVDGAVIAYRELRKGVDSFTYVVFDEYSGKLAAIGGERNAEYEGQTVNRVRSIFDIGAPEVFLTKSEKTLFFTDKKAAEEILKRARIQAPGLQEILDRGTTIAQPAEESKSKKEEAAAGEEVSHQTWEDTVETDQQTIVNRTMTMAEAKRILEMTFNANGMKSYRGYKDAETWLREEGPGEVAMYAENTENVITQFMNRIPELTDYDVTFEEVFEAYLNGTLTGKEVRKARRMDTSKNTGYQDRRFYAPQTIRVTQEDLDTAMQRASGNSKEQVFAARRKILFAAHSADGLAALNISAKELNKLLRQWSRYPSRARDLSIELNRGVANENQWTGLQNSSILSIASVTDEDIHAMVKEIRGNSSQYQRDYIGRTMLALDTHIDWSHLIFDFVNTGNAAERALAYYNDSTREIVVGRMGSLNTVAHEMGHALDHKWERDLFGGKSSQALSDNTFDVSKITSDEGRQFYHNFTVFMDSLFKSSDITSSYEQRGTETFARFVARFTEWTEIQAGIKSDFEELHYKDRFTVAQYKEFVKLLQEKAALDAKAATKSSNAAQFQRWGEEADTAAEAKGREIAYARLQAENAALHDAVEGLKKLTGRYETTIGRLERRLSLTKTPSVRVADAQRLARQLVKEYGAQTDWVPISEQLKEIGDYILNTPAAKLSEEEIKNRTRAVAETIVDTAREIDDMGGELQTLRSIADGIKGTKLSIDASFLGDFNGREGFNSFRKSQFGKMVVTTREANSTEIRPGYRSVDQVYNDLMGEYGEGYFPADVQTEADQLRVIAAVLQDARGREINPFQHDYEEATEWLANKLAMQLMDGVLRAEAPTTMDRQRTRRQELQSRIAELRREGKLQEKEADRLRQTVEDMTLQLDRAESRYRSLSRTADVRMDKLREQQKIRLAEERAKREEKVKAVKEYYQNMAKKQREQRKNTASRQKIRKLIDKLNSKLARPTENRYVPRELVQVTIDVLQMIDTDTGRSAKMAEKLADIRAMYEGYKTDPKYSVIYDDTVADMLDNLAMTVRSTKLAKMSEVQLDAVYQTLRSLDHVISTAVQVKIGTEERNAYELSKEMTAETRDIPKAQTSWLKNKWLVSHLRADVMFSRFGGFKKNSAWNQIGRMLNDGQLKQTRLKMELSRPFAGLVNNRKGMEDFTGTSFFGRIQKDKLVDIGLKDENGQPILVTHDIMVGIYMDLLNEDNRRHFIRGGKTIPNLNDFYSGKGGFGVGSTRAVGIAEQLSELQHDLSEARSSQYGDWAEETQAKIDALLSEGERYADSVKKSIEEQLTDFDRKWIEATQQLMDQDSKRHLNETTMEVYGIEKARVEHYFPITTDPNFLNTPFESVAKNMSLENAGFMKERVTASNPTLALGTFTAVNTQIERVAQYCGLMPVLRSFGKVYNKTGFGYSDSIKNALNAKFGKDAAQYLDGLIADLTGSRAAESDTMGINQLLGRLRGNLAQTSLTLNVRVALAQAASYPTAAAELGWSPLAKALAKGGKDGRMISPADQELIAKWSPLLWLRMQGYSTQELGDIKNNNSAQAKLWKKARWFTGWIQAVDGATVGRLWYASEYWVQDHHPDLEKGSDAYYEAVAKKFNDVVEKTQPNYTTMQRATILRDPSALVKTFTMFMTQRLQNFNIVYDATASYQKARADLATGKNGVTRADVAEAKQTMVRAVSSQIAQAAVYVGFKLLADALLHSMKAYRDDDTGELDAESIGAKLLDNYMDAVMGSFLGGSEIYTIFKSVIGQQKWYGLSVSGVDSINDLVEDIVALANTKDAAKRNAKILNVAKSLAQTMGLPLNNAIKLGQAVQLTIEDIVSGNPWQSAGYEVSKKQQSLRDLEAAGVSVKQYGRIFSAADSDGNNKMRQDELGPYLQDAVSKGEITHEQAEAVWNAQGWTTSMGKWAESTAKKTENAAQEAPAEPETPTFKETVKETPKPSAPQEEPEETDYDRFMAGAPVYSDSRESAYEHWETEAKPAGVSMDAYLRYLNAADTNGNHSVTQAEMADVLLDAIDNAEITDEQAEIIWHTLWHSARSKSFSHWVKRHINR